MAERYDFPSSGIDLKDVVGSDNKLEAFVNSTKLSPELKSIPKVGSGTVHDLKKVGITTTNQLIGKFASFNFEFADCLEWMNKHISFTQRKQILICILFKLEMMGMVIPPVPDDWRKL